MPSNAFTNYLEPLLKDAEELGDAHKALRTGNRGRQWRLGALNRSVVVMCTSAWEGYVEEVAKEAVNALRPATPPLGAWPALAATVHSAVGRFNTPNSENVKLFLRNAVGISDVTAAWSWQRCAPPKARDRLNKMLTARHHVAHGVNPRPTIHNGYAKMLPMLVRRLASCTDGALATHLSTTLGVAVGW